MNRVCIVHIRIFVRIAFWSIVVGACAGAAGMHYFYDKNHVPQEAMRQARAAVDGEMQAACSNWFTDKRSKDLPEGRVVVCKAPQFMSNPTISTELK